jgi:HD-GYP domain-containing protein (c-di-GMP phosphodiesterase class II)
MRPCAESAVVELEERVPIEEVTDLIRVGEPLPFKVLDAQARLLLNEGQRIMSARQHEMLVERGAWVDRRLVQEMRDKVAGRAGVEPVRRVFTLFDRWERLIWELDAVLRRTARGTGQCLAEWTAVVDEVFATLDKDPDIALYVSVRHDDRRFALYPQEHALHTAVLVLMAARAAQWPEARQRSAVAAALSMNVAMIELQAQMAEQDEPPRPGQIHVIRAHPLKAVKLLQDAGVTDMMWLRAVAEHHEHGDGSGYPRGLEKVSPEAELLRMADVYMAKITPRAFRPPLPPLVASAQLFQQAKDSPMVVTMIRAIGVHPPGTLVRLKSGEVAVVKRRAGAAGGPLVCTLSDAAGRPRPDSHERNAGEATYGIAGSCDDTTAFPRVLAERVYGLVLG